MLAASAPSAFAQFGGIFGDPPPRPPASVPGGRPQGQQQQFPQQQQPRPAPQQFPQNDQFPERLPPGPPPSARRPPPVQSEPLAPPPGVQQPSQQAAPTPGLPAGIRQPKGTPQPANTAPQPGDEVVSQPATQKIPNQSAVFSGLDKITGRIINFDAAIGETVQFGALQVVPRVCYTRPPTEAAATDAFIEVSEVTLQGEVRRIFAGWMFAASPGLNAVEHPIYDVWLTDCKQPLVKVAEDPPPVQPAAATPQQRPATQPAASQQQRPSQQAQQPQQGQPQQPARPRPQPQQQPGQGQSQQQRAFPTPIR